MADKDYYWRRNDPDYLLDPEEEADLVYTNPSALEGQHPKDAYIEYTDSDYWKQVKRAVFSRDGNKCVHCNRSDYLHVHHKRYCKRGTELSNLHLLETVCRWCHAKEHGEHGYL